MNLPVRAADSRVQGIAAVKPKAMTSPMCAMGDRVLTGQLTFTSHKPCDLSRCTKADLLAYFENAYDLNESLYTGLRDESVFYKCPDRLRLPLIFYYGHTACVYINKLILAGLLTPADRVNLSFETLFETGVDEMSWDDTENYRMGGKFQWPRLDDVIEYRRRVRHAIRDVIRDTPLELPVTMESPWWGLLMGVEHERIHLETSSVLIRQLPVAMVTTPEGWRNGPLQASEPVTQNAMVKVTSQDMTLGKPKGFPSYGWDNCYGNLEVSVPGFEASQYLVTNREMLAFVEDAGYERDNLWTEEGWQWCCYRKAKHPCFWVCKKGCRGGCGGDLGGYSHCRARMHETPDVTRRYNGYDPDVVDAPSHLVNGQNGYCNGHNVTDSNGHQGKDEGGGQEYRLRRIYDEVPLPPDWPAEVNFHEAKAFAAWRGADYRLLTEAEHHAVRAQQEVKPDDTSCDIIFHDVIKANLNLNYGSSTPVNLYPPNARGFYDPCGNVWQWTEDHFNGLPDFSTSPLYDDFSAPCFDGRHNVILGGSWISTGDEASRFARFAFRRHFFQHAGFRLVRSLPAADGTRPPVPARLVSKPVYVLGAGEQDSSPSDAGPTQAQLVPTTYAHYLMDTEEAFRTQLVAEYSDHGSAGVSYRLVALCTEWLTSNAIRHGSALHLGCGVGSVTFKLAEIFQQTVGVDFSARFVDACNKLKSGGKISYSAANGQTGEASLEKAKTDNLVFKQMTWLPNELGVNDFVLVTFLDRVQNVQSWTVRFLELVRQDGLLVVTSSGRLGDEALEKLLGRNFELQESLSQNGPGSVCHVVTAWRRK